MGDPLDYTNQLLKWPDPPPQDERWERKVAAACEMVAGRDAEIERLKRLNATYVRDNGRAQDELRQEIERLREEQDNG